MRHGADCGSASRRRPRLAACRAARYRERHGPIARSGRTPRRRRGRRLRGRCRRAVHATAPRRVPPPAAPGSGSTISCNPPARQSAAEPLILVVLGDSTTAGVGVDQRAGRVAVPARPPHRRRRGAPGARHQLRVGRRTGRRPAAPADRACQLAPSRSPATEAVRSSPTRTWWPSSSAPTTRRTSTPPARYRASLRATFEQVARARAAGAHRARAASRASAVPCARSSPSSSSPTSTRACCGRSAAQRPPAPGAAYADIHARVPALIAGRTDVLSSDGFHPSAVLYDAWARVIFEALAGRPGNSGRAAVGADGARRSLTARARRAHRLLARPVGCDAAPDEPCSARQRARGEVPCVLSWSSSPWWRRSSPAWALAAPAAGSETALKVAIIVGPVGEELTPVYICLADAAADGGRDARRDRGARLLAGRHGRQGARRGRGRQHRDLPRPRGRHAEPVQRHGQRRDDERLGPQRSRRRRDQPRRLASATVRWPTTARPGSPSTPGRRRAGS